MKQMQKWLCGLLAVCMVLLLVPMTASAAETGSCGENVTWTFENGVLTISGSGPVANYAPINEDGLDTSRPWDGVMDQIHTIIVEEGVTVIGTYAFYECPNLESLTLPSSVKDIYWNAFERCPNLKELNLAEGLRSIGYMAFSECTSLTEVVFPAGLEVIHSSAFAYCTALELIVLPVSLVELGYDAFDDCNNLRYVCYEGSEEQWNRIECDDPFAFPLAEYYFNYVPVDFIDVPEGTWYTEAVLWAARKGIAKGMTENTFEPGGLCNRAQVLTFLWRAAGSPQVSKNEIHKEFADVEPGSWYEMAVRWALSERIVDGMTETEFGPDLPCNRAQLVTFLWRLEGEPDDPTVPNDYIDVENGTWYTKAVQWATAMGAVNGLSETEFGPNETCNRAQVVTILHRLPH